MDLNAPDARIGRVSAEDRPAIVTLTDVAFPILFRQRTYLTGSAFSDNFWRRGVVAWLFRATGNQRGYCPNNEMKLGTNAKPCGAFKLVPFAVAMNGAAVPVCRFTLTTAFMLPAEAKSDMGVSPVAVTFRT